MQNYLDLLRHILHCWIKFSWLSKVSYSQRWL